jgi:hypothetical protein
VDGAISVSGARKGIATIDIDSPLPLASQQESDLGARRHITSSDTRVKRAARASATPTASHVPDIHRVDSSSSSASPLVPTALSSSCVLSVTAAMATRSSSSNF